QVTILSYLAVFVFVGLFFVSSFMYAVRRERRQARSKLLQGKQSIYFRLQRFFLKENSVEQLLFCVACAQHILRVLYLFFFLAAFIGYFGISSLFFWRAPVDETHLVWFGGFLIVLLLSLIVLADFLPRMWAHHFPSSVLRLSTPIASFFLLLFSPFSFL